MTRARSRAVSSPLLRRRASALVAAGVLALSGCAGSGIDTVRDNFVAAGGSCDEWTPLHDPRATDSIECADGARLYLFPGDAERADFVKTELESNDLIRARTHILLSGENWLVFDRIAVIVHVMPHMHGMIQGRNGANP